MKKKILKTFVLITIFLFFLSFLPLNVNGVPEAKAISCLVTFSDGTPVGEGVEVTATNIDRGNDDVQTTDEQGKSRFSLLGSDGDELVLNVSYVGNNGSTTIIYDDSAPSQSCTVTISGNEFPTADFSYTPLDPEPSDTITFTDASSDPENGTNLTYEWDFDDGSISYQKNTTHSYSQEGTYTVTLTVFDYYGAYNITFSSITVEEEDSGGNSGGNNNNGGVIPDPNDPPVAVADFPKYGLNSENVIFNGSQSYDSDGSIVNYTWFFGDGNISYGVKTSHSYKKNGTYQVELSVQDDEGLTDTFSEEIIINLSQGFVEDNKYYMSYETRQKIETSFNVSLPGTCYVADLDNDSKYDTFNDTNNVLYSIRKVVIDANVSFLISANNDLIPEFFWIPSKENITNLTYIIANDSTIKTEQNGDLIYNSIKIKQNNWSIVETENIRSDLDFIVKNSEKKNISKERIWMENDRIFILDNTSSEYQIIYTYEIWKPVFEKENNSVINSVKPKINFSFSEKVIIIEAYLNNVSIITDIYTDDDVFFSYIPGKDLENGRYNLTIKVVDSDGNTRTSVFSFKVNSSSSFINQSSEVDKDEQNSSIFLVFLVVLAAFLVFFVFRKKFF